MGFAVERAIADIVSSCNFFTNSCVKSSNEKNESILYCTIIECIFLVYFCYANVFFWIDGNLVSATGNQNKYKTLLNLKSNRHQLYNVIAVVK